jgi:hypothetical protein
MEDADGRGFNADFRGWGIWYFHGVDAKNVGATNASPALNRTTVRMNRSEARAWSPGFPGLSVLLVGVYPTSCGLLRKRPSSLRFDLLVRLRRNQRSLSQESTVAFAGIHKQQRAGSSTDRAHARQSDAACLAVPDKIPDRNPPCQASMIRRPPVST